MSRHLQAAEACPDMQTLKHFAARGLSPAEMDGVRDHVARCPLCEGALEDYQEHPLERPLDRERLLAAVQLVVVVRWPFPRPIERGRVLERMAPHGARECASPEEDSLLLTLDVGRGGGSPLPVHGLLLRAALETLSDLAAPAAPLDGATVRLDLGRGLASEVPMGAAVDRSLAWSGAGVAPGVWAAPELVPYVDEAWGLWRGAGAGAHIGALQRLPAHAPSPTLVGSGATTPQEVNVSPGAGKTPPLEQAPRPYSGATTPWGSTTQGRPRPPSLSNRPPTGRRPAQRGRQALPLAPGSGVGADLGAPIWRGSEARGRRPLWLALAIALLILLGLGLWMFDNGPAPMPLSVQAHVLDAPQTRATGGRLALSMEVSSAWRLLYLWVDADGVALLGQDAPLLQVSGSPGGAPDRHISRTLDTPSQEPGVALLVLALEDVPPDDPTAVVKASQQWLDERGGCGPEGCPAATLDALADWLEGWPTQTGAAGRIGARVLRPWM